MRFIHKNIKQLSRATKRHPVHQTQVKEVVKPTPQKPKVVKKEVVVEPVEETKETPVQEEPVVIPVLEEEKPKTRKTRAKKTVVEEITEETPEDNGYEDEN